MVKVTKKATLTVASLALAANMVLPSWSTANAADFYIVVNEANGFSGSEDEAKALARRIFLKNAKSWPGGKKAVPFARKTSSPEQMALLSEILGMSDSEHVQHWARQKQTTGDTPPRAVGSNSILLRLVKREEGSIAIVDGSGPEPEGVRVLLKISN